jgi:uncharacterized protein (TIGR00369 family)
MSDTDVVATVTAAREAGEPDRLVALVPYARFLGVSFDIGDDGSRFRLPFRDSHIGNPHLPAMHGGLMGAFMESAAIIDLLWRQEALAVPKVVDFAIDYLRPGRPQDLFAGCDIRRQGKRVANVGITAWQVDDGGEVRTIATARSHFLVGEASTSHD